MEGGNGALMRSEYIVELYEIFKERKTVGERMKVSEGHMTEIQLGRPDYTDFRDLGFSATFTGNRKMSHESLEGSLVQHDSVSSDGSNFGSLTLSS